MGTDIQSRKENTAGHPYWTFAKRNSTQKRISWKAGEASPWPGDKKGYKCS